MIGRATARRGEIAAGRGARALQVVQRTTCDCRRRIELPLVDPEHRRPLALVSVHAPARRPARVAQGPLRRRMHAAAPRARLPQARLRVRHGGRAVVADEIRCEKAAVHLCVAPRAQFAVQRRAAVRPRGAPLARLPHISVRVLEVPRVLVIVGRRRRRLGERRFLARVEEDPVLGHLLHRLLREVFVAQERGQRFLCGVVVGGRRGVG